MCMSSVEYTTVLLSQIILSPSIMKAISDWTVQPINITNPCEDDGAFKLSRMARMMDATTEEFDTLIASDVIQVRRKKGQNGKNQGIRIDGIMRQLFVIANGRHRIARAIIEGKTSVLVEILD